jgi:hypothetical protein
MAQNDPMMEKDLIKHARTTLIFPRFSPAIGGILLLSILTGLSVAALSPSMVLTGLGVIVAIALFTFSDQTVLLVSVLVLSVSFSSAFWLDHRIYVGDFPLSIPDGIVVLYGLYGLVMWLRKGASLVASGGRTLLILWFLYNSVWTIGLGLNSGNSAYAILQEYRLVLYATIAYFATLVIFHPERHLPVLMRNLIWAGLIVSIWQLVITISGRQMAPEEIVFMTGSAIGRVLRDVNLPLYFAGTALMFLVVTKIRVPFILGKTGHLVWILIPIFVTAMLISLTRTVWFSLAISVLLLFSYILVTHLSADRLLRWLVLIFGFLVTLFAISLLVQIFLPSVYQAVSLTLNFTLFSKDTTRYERSQIILGLVQDFYNSGEIWSGIGFGNMWSGATRMGLYYNLHNTYLAYMVIGGLPGLLLFLGIWIYPLIVYVRLLRRSPGVVLRAFGVASVMNWIMTSTLMLAMPPHWTESALFGLTLGIASILGRNQTGRQIFVMPTPRSGCDSSIRNCI